MITTHTGARSWRNQRGRHRPTAVPGRIPAPPGDRPGVRPTARSEALPEPRPRAQAMALPGEPAPALHTGEAVAATWFGEIWSRAHRLGEGRAAVADAGPDLIHDLRIYVRRLCALSDLLPRPPGARPMRRALRKEVAWAMQRCRGRAIGTSSRWKCCRSSAMPIRISIRKPRPRGLAPAPRSRTTRCTPTCRPNASRPCCACSGNAARRSPPPWPSARPGRCIARSAAASRVGTRRCARAWITPPTRGRGASMRRGSASNACAMPARRCCCSVHPASSSATSRPWPTCKARWAARRTSVQPPRWGAMCVSLSTGRLAGRQGDKAALRLLRRAGDGLRSASRRLLRRPSFWAQASRGRVARRPPAGAEAPRATA